jgi:hypothetical protein
MPTRLQANFLYSAGFLLLLTGAAKLISILSRAHILDTPDPIIGVPFRTVFLTVGELEFLVGLACFRATSMPWRASLVAWLASSFVAYRLGLVWVGWDRPCPCAGTLTDALHLPPQAADAIMKAVLAYLFVGSYACLWSCCSKILAARRHAQVAAGRAGEAHAYLTTVESHPASAARGGGGGAHAI